MKDHNTAAVYNAALEYIRQGWHVLQLHCVDEHGRCSCKAFPCGNGNRNAGKHPVQSGWTKAHKPSETDAWTIWIEDDVNWNIGIVTGETSGFFVLDIDPKDGGYETLAAWEVEYGKLPDTYTVTTGSGGRHYYFSLPDFEIRNSAKKLGEGVDIRGNGGQVVAASSRSNLGEYTVALSAPICAAPQWLLDKLSASPTFDTVDTIPVEDLPIYSDLPIHVQHRAQKYAEAAVRGEVEDYVNAESGTGNHQLFATSCKLIELAQSTWNLLTVKQVEDALNEGRIRRCLVTDGGQTADEFQKTFRSAGNTVVGQGREFPEKLLEDDTPDLSEFIIPGITDRVLDLGKDESGGTEAGAYEAYFFRKTQEELFKLRTREAAKKLLDEERATVDLSKREDAIRAFMEKMLTPSQLDDMPGRVQLVEDFLDMDSESWIIGPPGGFKSFVALDIAAHVATGRAWQGRKVEQGPVVYLVAEGAKGIINRKKAWEKAYGPMTNVHFLPMPVQVTDTETWAIFVEACKRIKPHLVVLDTQARISVGLEENSATAMGQLIHAITQLRQATGACILTVHHSGRNGGDARGSSALDGAQDTEIKVTRKDKKSMTAEITTDKSKDGDENKKILIQLEVHEVGTDERMGNALTSLAIKADSMFMPLASAEPSWRLNLTENMEIVLSALTEHMEADPNDSDRQFGITAAELRRLIKKRAEEGHGRDIPETSTKSALRDLLQKKHIFKSGTKYYTEDPESGD